jgi:hypothetical protein
MFFTRKKVQRDREAGLTFVWRGARSNTLGLVVAFGLVAALTALLGSVVRVTVVPPSEVAEQHATVVVLPVGAEDGGLVALAEERSPLPSRFDPERELAQAVMGGDALQANRPVYAPELADLPDDEGGADLPLAPVGALVLPVRRPAPPQASAGGPNRAAATLLVRGELGARLPESLPGWDGPAAPEWIGRPLTFVVGVDGGGRVRHCVPLDESLEALDVQAESWLRRVRLRPAAPAGGAALTWGAVEFRLTFGP